MHGVVSETRVQISCVRGSDWWTILASGAASADERGRALMSVNGP